MINLYVLPKCPRCEELKSYMNKNKIPYKEYNVENNPRALVRITLQGFDQYPIVEINDRFYYDSVDKLKRIVKSFF